MNRLKRILKKTQGMTPSEVGAEVLLRIRRNLSHSYHRIVDEADKTYITEKQLLQAFGDLSVATVADLIREGGLPHLTAGLGNLERTAGLARQLFPESVAQTLKEAADIIDHRIVLFGRPFDFGERIDWNADLEVGGRWQLAHYTRVQVNQSGLSDARVVWELNRLHHLTTLGRAYALTRDERYTTAFINQLTSWCEANPPRFGINWTVAMEAAIRVVNLSLAVDFFRASPLITNVVVELILKTLLAHGRFIRKNLEFSYRVTSNHYLSDLLGLFVLGVTFPCFTESQGWVQFSAGELLREMRKQILADGVDTESSIAYHRLAVEIFTLFFTLSRNTEVDLPDEDWRRLEAMFDFTRAYLKPDFTAPVIGDSDDGRIIKFTERPPADHSYLLAIAAVLFEKSKYKLTDQIDEEALWWFGEDGLRAFERLLFSNEAPPSQGFAEAQVFVQRRGHFYAILDGGDNGLGGRGSHAHSDALSFELFAYGLTFLRDPGTYVYTTSKRWRNLFRSTAYHNTVRVDRQEINAFDTEQLFWMGANVRPRINSWVTTDEEDIFDAEHDGYTRLAEPVTHRRILTFNKPDGFWILEDHFTGAGHHLFEFCFNFDAGLDCLITKKGYAVAHGQTTALAIVPMSGHAFKVKRARRWVSPRYRTRLPSSGIIYHLRESVPFKNVMLLIPYAIGDEERVAVVRGQWSGVGGQ